MKYTAAKEIFEMYPGYVRGVVVAKGVTNGEQENAEILALLREAEETVRQRSDLKDISQHPRIASWRAAYARFGARPSRFHSSIEAMVRRVRKGGKLPYINRLFKNVGIGRESQSLMLMVSPRIIIQEEEEERLGIQ